MLPSLLQRTENRYPYQGIHILGPDAEVYYAARVREVYDGFPAVGNAFFSAPKDQPAMQPPLPELTIAYGGMALGLSALHAFLLSKIILAIAVFIMFVVLVWIVTDRPWVSLLATVVALEAGALLAAPWDLPLFLHPSSSALEFLRFSRAINPQWTVTFFLINLSLLALWVKSSRRVFLYAAALCSFTLIYSYVYAWTYFFAIAGVLSLWFLSRRQWSKVIDLLIFWLIIFAVFVPYLLHLSVLTQHPWYSETSMRLGMVLRHGPAIFSVWNAVFIGLALASRPLWPRTWPLLPATAIAGFIAFNQQLLTGHAIVPHHYNWYFIQPLASIFACALVLSIIPMQRFSVHLKTTFGVMLIMVCTMISSIQQWVGYNGIADFWGIQQPAAPVIKAVSTHIHTGQSVYSQDSSLLNLVPIYSSADVYYTNNANLFLTPDERSRFGYFLDLWLQGVTPEEAARDFFGDKRFMLSSRLHAIYYREAVGDYAKIPPDEILKNIDLYRDFYALSLQEKLSRYPIHAVITTPHDPQNPVWSRFLACSTEFFTSNGYALRMMIPAGSEKSCL